MKKITGVLRVGTFGLLLLAGGPGISFGQDAGEPYERGVAAFREGRYEEAVQLLERLVKDDPSHAEAHYMLARLYFETPLRDPRRADRAIERAIELEPDNVQYLVARLQQLKREGSNFISEQLRDAHRRELAHRILKIDSTNGFAHQELGITYIRDFWRYRNAIALPALGFSQKGYRRDQVEEHDLEQELRDNPNAGQQFTSDPERFGDLGTETSNAASLMGANDADIEDRFDLDQLRSQGVPVQDLSRRADLAYRRAIGHLGRALESDPMRRPVYDQMMQIYALRGAYADALKMLESMYVFFPEDPGLWLYLGAAHYRAGNFEAAAKSFETAFTFMPADTRAAFEDLEIVLPEREKDRYRPDPVQYATRFWTSKDPRYLTPYNERKLEHYARLVHADLLYGSSDLNKRGWETERGQILVRYGLPEQDVVISGGFEAVLHGAEGLNMASEGNLFNVWDYGEFRFVFEDPFQNGEFRLYSPPANAIAQGVSRPELNDYVRQARETFRDVPERYQYEAPGRQVEIPYLVNAFKGEGSLADVYVHFGIPIQQYDPARPHVDLNLSLGSFLISADRDLLAERRQTIVGLRTDQILPFAETNLWMDTQTMKAPPGKHEVSVEFETATGGTVAVQRRPIQVPDFASGRLAVSDVMLAYAVEEADAASETRSGRIVRNGLEITPAPWSVFSAKQPVYLYFETYNLKPASDGRTAYEVEAVLTPRDDARGVARLAKNLFGRDRGVSVRFEGGGTRPDDGQYLILDPTGQEPGIYRLTVRVRDRVAGRSVEAEKDVFLE